MRIRHNKKERLVMVNQEETKRNEARQEEVLSKLGHEHAKLDRKMADAQREEGALQKRIDVERRKLASIQRNDR